MSRSWQSTGRGARVLINRCNEPPWVIASPEFNESPVPLRIDGARESNRTLFALLEEEDDWQVRARRFEEFLSVRFRLHEWEEHTGSAGKSLRNSYVRFLRGWAMDSNSVEGAVLKAWVESRFGLPPTWHHGPLRRGESGRYAFDRMRGHARTSAIDSQLDLLYEFCQYELGKRFPERTHFELFRGTCDADEYEVLGGAQGRESLVRLNNLSSFTIDRERAWEFGSTVWAVRVPLTKVFFFADLLPSSILRGEGEMMVIGGVYAVRALLF